MSQNEVFYKKSVYTITSLSTHTTLLGSILLKKYLREKYMFFQIILITLVLNPVIKDGARCISEKLQKYLNICNYNLHIFFATQTFSFEKRRLKVVGCWFELPPGTGI